MEGSSTSKYIAAVGSDYKQGGFQMTPERMIDGNINSFVKAHKDANWFELIT